MDNNMKNMKLNNIQLVHRKILNQDFTLYDVPYENLYETLETTARCFPNKIGLIDDREEISYSNFKNRVDAYAWYLRNILDVKKGERIALFMLNGISFCTAFYAAVKIGCIVSLINAKLQKTEIAYILKDSGAKKVAVHSELWVKLKDIIVETELDTIIFDKEIEDCDFIGNTLSEATIFNYVKKNNCNITTEVERDSLLPAAIVYTSGSSGTPKGAILSHIAILQTIHAYKEILKMDENDSTLLAVPIFHVTGLSCIMALFIYLGGLMVIMPKFHSKECIRKLVQYKITHFHAVPTIYIMLNKAMNDSIELLDLKSAVCGGGAIEEDVMETFCSYAKNVSFQPAYGMTETAGGGVLFPNHYFNEKKPNSAGKVMANAEVKIIDDEHKEVPTGECGQICFRSTMVSQGYWRKDRNISFIGEWLLSGDIGKLDEDNYIYIEGRIKSMINRGGEKIYPQYVEKEIKTNQKVELVVVFPVKDSLFGEVPGAVIVPKQGAIITQDEMIEYLKSRISNIQIPHYFEFREKLPYTATGKVKIGTLINEFYEKYYK